jgi:hypothetical protein
MAALQSLVPEGEPKIKAAGGRRHARHLVLLVTAYNAVMPGLVPGIHALLRGE